MQVESIFKALADPTRLRIMRLLAAMELAVGELAQVLEQSQPRVSRHVGILCDAGLAERRREGSWVFLHTPSSAEDNALLDAMIHLLATAEREDAGFAKQCLEDRRKLAAIRAGREETAQAYFSRHAGDWDELRQLHSSDEQVEAALLDALGDDSLGDLLDIGTGTGRIAELLSERANKVTALDKSLEMLKLARAKLQHLPAGKTELVPGDFTDLPFGEAQFDTVLLHQVLHFAQEPELVLHEAARVTRGGGQIAIVDFATHGHEELRTRHAHARLGFADNQIRQMLREAGYSYRQPVALDGGELVVKIWIGERKGAALGKPQSKEHTA